eukprot:gene15050-biopygen9690
MCTPIRGETPSPPWSAAAKQRRETVNPVISWTVRLAGNKHPAGSKGSDPVVDGNSCVRTSEATLGDALLPKWRGGGPKVAFLTFLDSALSNGRFFPGNRKQRGGDPEYRCSGMGRTDRTSQSSRAGRAAAAPARPWNVRPHWRRERRGLRAQERSGIDTRRSQRTRTVCMTDAPGATLCDTMGFEERIPFC